MTTITVKIGAKDYTVETDCAPGTVLEVWGGWEDRDGLKSTRICEVDGVEYFLVEFQTPNPFFPEVTP